MRIGIGIGLTMARVGNFTPAALPGLSAWYDPSDLSTLFQDDAMTIPVTTAGQSVAVIKDKSGNGYNLTQATAAARPLYKTDGTLHWLEGDGVDDILTGTIPISAYPFTIAAAFKPISTTDGGIAGLYQGESDYKSLMVNNYLRAVDRTSAQTQQASVTSSGAPPATAAIASFTGTSCELTTQSYMTSATGFTQTFGSQTDFRLFSLRNSNRWNGRIYAAAVISGTLNASDKTSLLQWLASRVGITL